MKEENGGASWPYSKGPGFVHYLITRREPLGFEAPHTFFRSGEGVMPVFCSEEAARRCLASLALDDEWHVRGFSVGEMVSLLFALHERVAWVLPNPLPGLPPAKDELSCPVSRDGFIEFLIER